MKYILSIVTALVGFSYSSTAFADGPPIRAGNLELNVGSIIKFQLRKGNATNTNSVRPVDKTVFTLGPVDPEFEIGYFITDHISVGGSINYMASTAKDQQGTHTVFTVNPFLKYYVPVTDKFVINYIWRIGWESEKHFGEMLSTSQLYAKMGVAFDYFLFKNVAVYTSFDYRARFHSIIGKNRNTGFDQYSFVMGPVFFWN